MVDGRKCYPCDRQRDILSYILIVFKDACDILDDDGIK